MKHTIQNSEIEGANVSPYQPPTTKEKLIAFGKTWLMHGVLVFIAMAIFYWSVVGGWLYEEPPSRQHIQDMKEFVWIMGGLFLLLFNTPMAWLSKEWYLESDRQYYYRVRGSKIYNVEMLPEDKNWITERSEQNGTDEYTELKRCIELGKEHDRNKI